MAALGASQSEGHDLVQQHAKPGSQLEAGQLAETVATAAQAAAAAAAQAEFTVREADGIRVTSHKEQPAPEGEAGREGPEIRVVQPGLGQQQPQQQDPGSVLPEASRQGASRMPDEQGRPGGYLVGQEADAGQQPHMDAVQPGQDQAGSMQDAVHDAAATGHLPDEPFEVGSSTAGQVAAADSHAAGPHRSGQDSQAAAASQGAGSQQDAAAQGGAQTAALEQVAAVQAAAAQQAASEFVGAAAQADVQEAPSAEGADAAQQSAGQASAAEESESTVNSQEEDEEEPSYT